jgi:hypothetical protein
MGELCWLVNRYLLTGIPEMIWLARAALLGVTIAAGAVVYFFFCYFLGVTQAQDGLSMILRRVPGLKRFARRAGK